jgi:hypothetical protein
MASMYAVEIEPEVRSWLSSLTDRDFGRVDFHVGLLPNTLRSSANHTRGISAGESASCGSTC